jgi:MFS family permease
MSRINALSADHASHRVYYGWFVVLAAALAMVGTLPGRSQGLGLITEPLIRDLRIDRFTYATVNFWATIAGAAGAIGIGRAIDRFGARVVLSVVSLVLGLTVAAMSRVSSIATLTVALAATRAVGQGALSVVSIAVVGHWFTRRINSAMAIYSALLSAGFMIAFPVVGILVQARGWRTTWLVVGASLVFVLAPLSWAIVRRGPESIGLLPDGDTSTSREAQLESDDLAGIRAADALRTGAFWVFAAGTALYGLVASGIGLFNESILAERGFNHDVYYQTLVVTAMTALAGNFIGGWLTSRLPLTRLMAIALIVLAAGVAAMPILASLTAVMMWAAAMGLGGGIVMVLFFSVWPKAFGRLHLGQIQGVAQALTVLASAVGPLLLAWCVEATGSYAAMFRILSAIIALVAVSCLLVSLPNAIDLGTREPENLRT